MVKQLLVAAGLRNGNCLASHHEGRAVRRKHNAARSMRRSIGKQCRQCWVRLLWYLIFWSAATSFAQIDLKGPICSGIVQ
jgi:hypothetical protein